MKTYEDLQKKFDKDVKELQEKCKHKKSEWMQHMWAPGHYDGEVKVCLKCRKTLETRGSMPAPGLLSVSSDSAGPSNNWSFTTNSGDAFPGMTTTPTMKITYTKDK